MSPSPEQWDLIHKVIDGDEEALKQAEAENFKNAEIIASTKYTSQKSVGMPKKISPSTPTIQPLPRKQHWLGAYEDAEEERNERRHEPFGLEGRE
jgi:hypothetical protein